MTIIPDISWTEIGQKLEYDEISVMVMPYMEEVNAFIFCKIFTHAISFPFVPVLVSIAI